MDDVSEGMTIKTELRAKVIKTGNKDDTRGTEHRWAGGEQWSPSSSHFSVSPPPQLLPLPLSLLFFPSFFSLSSFFELMVCSH